MRGFGALHTSLLFAAAVACLSPALAAVPTVPPSSSMAAPSVPVVVLLSDGWSPPFAEYEGHGPARRLTGGFIRDWYLALGEQLGAPLEIRILPPSRIRAGQGGEQEGLRCFSDPQWDPPRVDRDFDRLELPHLVTREVLVGLAGQLRVSSPTQLRGKRIGAVMGYAYPAMEPLFADGVQRDDAPAEANMLEKQLAGRTDYAIVRLASLRHLQSRDARWNALVASPWVVSESRFHCAVRRDGAITRDRLRAAQERLDSNGTTAALMSRHGLD